MAEIDLDAIHWTTDGDGNYMPLIPSKAFNYPAESVVLQNVVFGYDDQYIGELQPSPNAARVVATDLRNGGDVRLDVSGSLPTTVNNVYVGIFGQRGEQEKRLVGTLTGDGSLTVSLPMYLYVCSVGVAGEDPSVAAYGNLFYVSDATNLTRVRIRDNVARSALRLAQRLGFQCVYESPDRLPVTLWAIAQDSSESMNMLGGETGTIGMTITIPRQVDFPPEDGLVPGARIGINGVWFACNGRWGTESIHLAATFIFDLRRLDISVEIDGTDV